MAYVVSDNAAQYRAIIDILADRLDRYEEPIRPDALQGELATRGHVLDPKTLQNRLTMLVQWGNVAASADTQLAATVGEYENRNDVYELSVGGANAHEALKAFAEKQADTHGALQTSMLRDINERLTVLKTALDTPSADPQKVYLALRELHTSFMSLTAKSTQFMQHVNSQLRDKSLDPRNFTAFKAATIDYLTSFITDLDTYSPRNTLLLTAINTHDRLDDVLAAAATCHDTPDSDAADAWIDQARQRLAGLTAWFGGPNVQRPRTEMLRRGANDAVRGIVAAVQRLADTRAREAANVEDWIALAGMFAECASDDDAHRLYRAALGVAGPVHHTLPGPDETGGNEKLSWRAAKPVTIAATLRETGARPHVRRANRVPDYSAAQTAAAARAQREREAAQAAARTLTGWGTVALSELPLLDGPTFTLLHQLLSHALYEPDDEHGNRRVRTTDGRLLITLTRPAHGGRARIESEYGTLTCPDYLLTVTEGKRRPALNGQRTAPEAAVPARITA